MLIAEHKTEQGSATGSHGSATLTEQQKQAISAAFHSTLLSNPHITLEIVLKVAEQ